jgi:D-alanine--poly(phosphoribitol) ligase subunit 1
MIPLWDRVAAHGRADPSRIAVTGTGETTYGELIESVRKACSWLSADCGPGDVVAINAATSLEALTMLLAARKLGSAFLPLDPGAPPSWRDYIVQNSGARAVVSQSSTSSRGLEIEYVAASRPGTAVPCETAYLMYTSGSTGRPKGVMVSERSLVDRLEGLAQVPGFSASWSFLAITALSFDIALAELLLPLSLGGRVVLAPPSARLDPAVFGEVVREYQPEVIQATPSFWRLVLATGWLGDGQATLWCGGEALSEGLAEQLSPRCKELWNLYGPTEATIWSTAWRADVGAAVSLGQPLPGSTCYLLDAQRRVITKPAVEGEIVLGGAGIAIGYLGNTPDQGRFTSISGSSERVYLTGDRGKYRADGSLEFLGRQDSQVKFRGHRLELGEVERMIEMHPAVQQAVVFLCNQDDAARAHLAAVVSSAEGLTDRELRGWLSRQVPQIMLPKRFLIHARLPRTTAGKVDRVALRDLLASTV